MTSESMDVGRIRKSNEAMDLGDSIDLPEFTTTTTTTTPRLTANGHTTKHPGRGKMITVTQPKPESPKPSHRRVGDKRMRGVRLEEPLWVLACVKAKGEGEGKGISEVVRRLLTAWIKGDLELPEA